MELNTLELSGSATEVKIFTSTLSKHEKEEYLKNCRYPFCPVAEKYEKIAKIGQGSFGEVFKARERKNPKRVVALKRILWTTEDRGFPNTSLREISILQHIKHQNIVSLIEVCRTQATQRNGFQATIFIVFEYCDHDLHSLLKNKDVKFIFGEIKNIMKQLLSGLYYLHNNYILHRDLKPPNILMKKNGVLKLADFGLSRPFSNNDLPKMYTNSVVTLWYRPPELLLGECNYGPSVDMWSAGCIMTELWTRVPLFHGHTEQRQLALISQLCGSITPQVWPGVINLGLYHKLELLQQQKRTVKECLLKFNKDPTVGDLLDKLLVLDPSKRLDADSALNHDFFWTNPLPCSLDAMLDTIPWRPESDDIQGPQAPIKPITFNLNDELRSRVF